MQRINSLRAGAQFVATYLLPAAFGTVGSYLLTFILGRGSFATPRMYPLVGTMFVSCFTSLFMAALHLVVLLACLPFRHCQVLKQWQKQTGLNWFYVAALSVFSLATPLAYSQYYLRVAHDFGDYGLAMFTSIIIGAASLVAAVLWLAAILSRTHPRGLWASLFVTIVILAAIPFWFAAAAGVMLLLISFGMFN